jgi:hypothetical protein
MIFLNKDSLNTVILTLTENSSLLNPNYIFEFINEMDLNSVIFSAPDLSTYKCRYNRFEIQETGSTFTNNINGIINLNRSGFWQYNVYETTGSTLQLSATTGIIIETGKVFVNGIDNQIPSIYQ